ncbi:MAG: phage holin family protein [Microbacteriaceae bacterium]|nr:phage holin family protein [Microbacteriaceae bacterium]
MSESTSKKRSLFALIADLPRLLGDLVREEIEQLKAEMLAKVKHAGVGIGLFAAAGFFAFFAIAVLIATAILGIAVALPAWLAALIVGVALLIITAILVGIGVTQVKRGIPPAPTETIESVKKDVMAIKGIGKRGTT